MVECSCTNKINKLMRTKETINERRPYIFVEWSCAKETINERVTYSFVEWLCPNKRNKSMWNLIFGRMAVHKRKIK